VAAEVALQTALAMAEQTGDVILQARCLAYLVVAGRRHCRDADVASYAHRAEKVARAAAMFEYAGASQAGLAWVAWRRGDLAEGERLGQEALNAWRQHTLPYPFYWQVGWPLMGIALARDDLGEAIRHAQRLRDPEQQFLPATLAEPLTGALAAWDAGRSDEARHLLHHALATAQQMHFS
jgi:eukaryotic-like serine/threonine-protein kinase